MGEVTIPKLVLTVGLAGAIALAMRAPAPRRSLPRGELWTLLGVALVLYAVGAAAALSHHSTTSALVLAGGVALCTLAAWLSRGGAPKDGGSHVEAPPPAGDEPGPAGPEFPVIDWDAFSRAMREWERPREPA